MAINVSITITLTAIIITTIIITTTIINSATPTRHTEPNKKFDRNHRPTPRGRGKHFR
jgi:hypothetical protein